MITLSSGAALLGSPSPGFAADLTPDHTTTRGTDMTVASKSLFKNWLSLAWNGL